jgi:hypothetical protein
MIMLSADTKVVKAMSLTSHLKDSNSPIGQFIKQRFSQTTGITKAANVQLRNAATINPGFESWVYNHLGMAIDYRIRYSFSVTPSKQLKAYTGAHMLQMGDSFPEEGPYSLSPSKDVDPKIIIYTHAKATEICYNNS